MDEQDSGVTEVTPQGDPEKAAQGSGAADSEAGSSGPGARLLAARERLRVSPQEVADELKLPTHVIDALEKDDFARLPPSVFSRGYLRSYARLLDLDPEELLKLYPQLSQEPDPSTRVAVVPLWQRMDKVQIAAIIGAGLVLLLVIVSLLFGAEEDVVDADGSEVVVSGTAPDPSEITAQPPVPGVASDPQKKAAGSPPAEAATAADGANAGEDDPAPELIEEVVRVDVEDEVPRQPAPLPRTTGSNEADAPAGESIQSEAVSDAAVSSPSTLVPIEAGVRRITETGEDRLTLTFTSDCWVEVKSADGANLYSDLNRPGRRLELVGDGPFHVRLGYAPGVELSFNGEVVPLERRTRNNVANLVLGQ